MTDPVDTNALRDLQALSGGILSRNLLAGSGVWKINRDVTRALGTAADEVDRLRAERAELVHVSHVDSRRDELREVEAERDRLRAVIERAPHGRPCANEDPENNYPCTCWKRRAL